MNSGAYALARLAGEGGIFHLGVLIASFLALAARVDAQGAKPYAVLPGGASAAAVAVNDRGQIVGGAGGYHGWPALWNATNVSPINLGNLGSSLGGSASGVNNLGHVTGSASAPWAQHAFFWTPEGGMIDLGSLGGDRSGSRANDISDSDLIAGESDASDGRTHAFLWSRSGGMIDLGSLGGGDAYAAAVNSRGQVVGCSTTRSGTLHPFLWMASTGMTDLDPESDSGGCARDINESGTIVGALYGNARTQAFVWSSDTGLRDLTPEDDDVSSFANHVNDNGVVVGGTFFNSYASSSAFIWTPAGGMAALELPGVSGSAYSVNNHGLIVGDASYTVTSQFPTAVTWSWSWDDVVVDGGSFGLWELGDSGSTWKRISPLNPATIAKGDLNGDHADELIVSYGRRVGVWVYRFGCPPFRLHGLAADQIAVGDLDGNGVDDVVLSFPGSGLWLWSDHGEWRQLHPENPTLMTIRRSTGYFVGRPSALVASFPGQGVWITNGGPTGDWSPWTRIDARDATILLAADVLPNGDSPGGGSEIIVGFAGAGLWAYDAYNAKWTLLHPFDVHVAAAGDLDGWGTDDLVVDFGPPHGLWVLRNGETWTQLSGRSAYHIALADVDGLGRDEIVVDFGAPFGLYLHSTVTGDWRSLRLRHIEGLLTATFH